VSDEDEESGEDEEPLLHNGSAARAVVGHQNGTAPSYGYKDVYGKVFEKRRQQLISVKVRTAHNTVHSL
jgi:hypothetical protein